MSQRIGDSLLAGACDCADASIRLGNEAQMQKLLSSLLRFPSVSGHEKQLVEAVAAWAAEAGLEVDLWQADESTFPVEHPVAQALIDAKHLPLRGRPVMVARLPGGGNGRSLIFNAHSDVVSPGDAAKWSEDPWSGAIRSGRVYGRGACDVKGGLVSALWAMAMLAAEPSRLAGDVMLELVPGEEDCVGLGTLASVARGYRADAAVILEPTESLPRCASRGGLRFQISLAGRAVHGTVKWLGDDAIARGRRTLDLLDEFQDRWNDRTADSLFADYPFARPITVDAIHGGVWQGMVCDSCQIAGYLELLPDDSADHWKQAFESSLREKLGDKISVIFSEQYAGHRLSPAHELGAAAAEAVGETFAWQGFNAGCEAGLRASLHGTPTLVWGPGSLAQAHCPDEYVEWSQVRQVAVALKKLAIGWCGDSKRATATAVSATMAVPATTATPAGAIKEYA